LITNKNGYAGREIKFLAPVMFFLQNYQKNQIKEEIRDKLRSEKNNDSPQTVPMFHHALGMADLASNLVSSAVVGSLRPLTWR
jgi:hypothetical protein